MFFASPSLSSSGTIVELWTTTAVSSLGAGRPRDSARVWDRIGGRHTVTLLYSFKVLSKKSKQDSERQHVFSLMQLHKRMCVCAHAHDIGRSLKR